MPDGVAPLDTPLPPVVLIMDLHVLRGLKTKFIISAFFMYFLYYFIISLLSYPRIYCARGCREWIEPTTVTEFSLTVGAQNNL